MFDVSRDLVPFAQFKNVENTHGGVLLLVKVQASACNCTKVNTTLGFFPKRLAKNNFFNNYLIFLDHLRT